MKQARLIDVDKIVVKHTMEPIHGSIYASVSSSEHSTKSSTNPDSQKFNLNDGSKYEQPEVIPSHIVQYESSPFKSVDNINLFDAGHQPNIHYAPALQTTEDSTIINKQYTEENNHLKPSESLDSIFPTNKYKSFNLHSTFEDLE